MKPARPKRTRQRAAARVAQPAIEPAELRELQEVIGYHFSDPMLLQRAMTHPSAILPGGDSIRLSNQRLEFLGDRVLNLVVAERLVERRQADSEGDLAPRLNRLVRKGACAAAMRHLGLERFLILSRSEIAAGGRERESTLGDACEAIIAAIYQDGGLAPARRFIERAWAPQFAHVPAELRDPKTLLQEWAQGQGHELPSYLVINRSGPDHAPVYEVEVAVAGTAARASGPSKREAERRAAAALLGTLTGMT